MIGSSIAHYRITTLLGEGGMGAVYRATDTKLNRDVAIKVLPAAFANDPDRLARFTREAQVLASLNHPNIATIHGIEEGAIVMELVDGPTLADRIQRGPIPLEDALAIARQIASALESAHEKAVIHRDLKPANVKVTPDGTVKVLDFGLAKLADPRENNEDPALSPTILKGQSPTVAGVILGTVGYMSPEQAKGKPVDKRADIWAFGVVLFEMLSGGSLYDGETQIETLAAMISKDPDFTRLPPQTPTYVRALLARCLDKDPRSRLRDIGEARITIDKAPPQPEGSTAKPASTGRGPRRWMVASGLLAVALATVSTVHFTAKPPELPIRTFFFSSTDMGVIIGPGTRRAVISPDGRHIVYVAGNKLRVRPLASEQVRELEGTEGAEGPFWSPDSTEIGLVSGGELKKVALTGGSPVTLVKVGAFFNGGAWSPDGRTILVAITRQGLAEVPAGGGVLKVLKSGTYNSPCYLPGNGKRLVIAATLDRGLELIDLDSGKSLALAPRGRKPAWFPGGVLYETVGRPFTVWALKLSKTGKPEGEPVRVLGVGTDFSVSSDGTLVWVDGAVERSQRQLMWRDRTGKKLDAEVPAGAVLGYVTISPQGTHAAYVIEEQGNEHIWVTDLSRASTRLTFGEGRDRSPIWSPTGQEIMYASDRAGQQVVLVQSASGGPPREVEAARGGDPEHWSPDGTTVLFRRTDPTTKIDMWAMKRLPDGSFGPAKPWLQTQADESRGMFSPDGRFVVYGGTETGQLELFVRPADGGAGQWQVSANGGGNPRWSRDGSEIFYEAGDSIVTVPVTMAGGTLRPGQPVELFRRRGIRSSVRRWDVHPDGKRFLIAEPRESEDLPESIHVIQNWQALLREKRPNQ